MRVLRSKKILALAAAVLVAAALAAVGMSAVLSQTVIADGTNIHFRVVRTQADTYDSGWHTHPGLAIVQVQSGSFQITQGSCTPKTVGAGETYIEVPYLPIRAVATAPVSWTTTLLVHFEEAPPDSLDGREPLSVSRRHPPPSPGLRGRATAAPT